MTHDTEHGELGEHAEQALRDLVELDRQVAEGEIPAAAADPLRRRYEVAAATALAEADEASPVMADPRDDGGRRWRPRPRLVAYGIAAAIALLAMALVPLFTAERPPGGFVTGNEAAGAPSPATVSDAALEQAVAQNPGVLGMRVALADRYTAQSDFGAAMRHYLEALRRAPNDPGAQTGLGWLLWRIGEPRDGLGYLERALATDPTRLDASWYKANIQLDGLGDPAGALATVEGVRRRGDLTAPMRARLDAFVAEARARPPGGAR